MKLVGSLMLICCLQVGVLSLHANAREPREGDETKRVNFSFDTRLRYNSAVVNRIERLNLCVAARMGRTEEAVTAFRFAGGEVGYRFDPVGYFWGSIPTTQLPKLIAVQDIVDFELDGPTSSGIDYIAPVDPKTLKPGSVWARQDLAVVLDDNIAKLPLLPAGKLEGNNPYMPWYLMGVPAFIKEHPSFDGRGTMTAVVEGYGDLLHPVLQSALTVDGKPTAKVAGIVDPSSSGDAYYDRFYDRLELSGHYDSPVLALRMDEDIHSGTKAALFRGQTFILPEPGAYRIARLENDRRAFWVLWSPEKSSVWVDTNQNHSFADEVELKDINRQFSAAEIPEEKNNQNGDPARASSFAIEINKSESEIKLFLKQDDHGTSVASLAAGNGFLGGRGNGVAPGARILYVTRGTGSLHQDIKAFILAASRADVDVVTASFVVHPMMDGETVTSLILDRLAQVYQKPIFVSATAGPNATTDDISDQGTGQYIFAIMGYETSETWHAFYGVNVPLHDNDPDAGGEGPAMSGALKPDFVTPFHQVAAGECNPRGSDDVVLTGAGYRLPPCYVKFGGTSASTPDAAGLASSLISGAKQTEMTYDLARISWAMRSSGDYLNHTDEPIGYQGYGLPNLPAAWKLLASDEPTPSFLVTSESNGPHEIDRRAPHVGMGVYEYGGWHPGMTGVREVTITRQSGDKQARHYRLAWRGNDGTFTAPLEVGLPLGKQVKIDVKLTPTVEGIHQAILQIVDPTNGVILHSFLNTLVASQPIGGKDLTATWHARIALSHEVCSIFDVEPETSAISADIHIDGGPAYFRVAPSTSRGHVDPLSYSLPIHDPNIVDFKEPGTKHLIFANPAAGSWAFCVRNHQGGAERQGKNAAYIQAKISLTSLRVDVKPKKIHVATALNGRSILLGEIVLLNQGNALERAQVDTQIGFAKEQVILLPPVGQTSDLQFKVGERTKKLVIELHVPEDVRPKTAVSIYACTEERCMLQDYQEDPELLEYRMPQAGTWKILAYRVGESTGTNVIPMRVDVTQIPLGASQSTPENGRLLQDIGALGLGARASAPIYIELPMGAAMDKLVVLTEVYDVSQEQEEEPSRRSFSHFNSEKSRPAVLGRAMWKFE